MPPTEGNDRDANDDGEQGVEETVDDLRRDLQLIQGREDPDDEDGHPCHAGDPFAPGDFSERGS